MNKFISKTASVYAIIFFMFSLTMISCSNSVDSDDDHEEHSEPFGVALIMNGLEIATQENGTLSYDAGNNIELAEGSETDLITIRWISEDGDRFEAHEDEGYSLQWSGQDDSIIEVETHEEYGPWEFHLKGIAIGETEIQFELWHNGEHRDFTSMPFSVIVQ